MKPNKKDSKEEIEDYEGIALFSMAKHNYKIADKYQKTLKEHLINLGYDEDDIDNWLWEAIIEDGEDWKFLIKN